MDQQSIVDPAYVDLTKLTAWMDDKSLETGPLRDVERLAGGTQNILLRFKRGERTFILRRPPEHLRANSNKTMRREAQVLAALKGTDVPHPGLIAACPEEDVLGASFYLMEPIEGFNPTAGLPEPHASDPKMHFAMGMSLVDAIAALGRVDYLEVGLKDFGRPDGFLERQVERWGSQLAGYTEHEGYGGAQIPGVDDVARWLDTNCPSKFTPGILHGDYHLANVMFSNKSADLAAIVDWELSTIGDPLLDLGWLLATWPEPGTSSPMGTIGIEPWGAFPTAADLIARYREGTTRDMTAISWYAVLACYKLGIILEGTHARACAGKADKGTGDLLHATTLGLFERAHKIIGES